MIDAKYPLALVLTVVISDNYFSRLTTVIIPG
jgi:hypothetical protein